MKESIADFAEEHAARLTKRFRKEVRRAAKDPSEEPIHDLRVSIRRLSQCLSEFRELLPRKKTKRTRNGLAKLMDLAAEMRNRDVAVKLVGKHSPALAATLGLEREHAKRKLTKALDQWRRREAS